MEFEFDPTAVFGVYLGFSGVGTAKLEDLSDADLNLVIIHELL